MEETTSDQPPSALSNPALQSQWLGRAALGLMLAGLYLISLHNYLLFHSLVEIFSIIVAGALFTIAWTARRYGNNPYLLFIGVAYLFVGGLDLLHTLAYQGMSIFPGGYDYATRLWLGARYLQSLSLLLAFLLCARSRPLRPFAIFAGYCLVSTLLVASIFVWQIFPEGFREGAGLTPFKKNSEYLISAILLLDMGLLLRQRQRFAGGVFRLLLWSLALTIISELAFTFYADRYGLSNLVGHYFKLFAFWLVYRAIIETSIEQPYQTIFQDLGQANQRLRDEVAQHIRTAGELRTALTQVKTLSGLLPICASCKKIRDDQEHWHTLEAYLSRHSEARFSHGYCPECYEKALLEVEKLHQGAPASGGKNR